MRRESAAEHLTSACERVMDATITPNELGAAVGGHESYVTDLGDFERLYTTEFPALHAVAVVLVGHADSEDVVQDTMFKALVNWRKVRNLDAPGGWCHRVLLNFCRGMWRRARTARRYQARMYERDRWQDSPSADVVAFWDAVRRLPTRPRMVVALRYGADRSTAEIATVLGLPEGTVRSDLSRAGAVLAKELRGDR